ncbi:MAG: hypothetical protein ACLUFI_06100 [Oscillospiraceae bacterium]
MKPCTSARTVTSPSARIPFRLPVAELEKKGFVCDDGDSQVQGERMIAVYLKDEFGGFAVHLLQK